MVSEVPCHAALSRDWAKTGQANKVKATERCLCFG